MEKLNLRQLLPLIDGMPEYAQLADALQGSGVRKLVVLDAAKPYTLAALHRRLKLPMLVVSAKPNFRCSC